MGRSVAKMLRAKVTTASLQKLGGGHEWREDCNTDSFGSAGLVSPQNHEPRNEHLLQLGPFGSMEEGVQSRKGKNEVKLAWTQHRSER